MTHQTPHKVKSSMIYNAATKSATLFIYGDIGPGWWDEGVTGKSFDRQLKAFGQVDTIDVWIDSNGGSAFDGISIYNTLNQHSAKKIVHIIARCCSSASVVAMAGDEIHIAENAFYMIHEAWAGATGTAKDLRAQADMLELVNKQVTETYAARTKQDVKAIADMMSAETWMDAKTAVAKGFATQIVPNKTVTAHAGVLPLNAVSLANYKHVPGWVSQSLLTLEKEAAMSTSTEPNKPADPPPAANMVELKAGFVYRLADGKVVSEAIKADPPPANPPAPPATMPQSAAEMQTIITSSVNAALLAANERYRNITALCTRAGVPEMSDKFLADPLCKVENVQAALLDLMIAKNVPAGMSGTPDASLGTQGDPTAKIKAEYAKYREMHMSHGVTEEAYVASVKQQMGVA